MPFTCICCDWRATSLLTANGMRRAACWASPVSMWNCTRSVSPLSPSSRLKTSRYSSSSDINLALKLSGAGDSLNSFARSSRNFCFLRLLLLLRYYSSLTNRWEWNVRVLQEAFSWSQQNALPAINFWPAYLLVRAISHQTFSQTRPSAHHTLTLSWLYELRWWSCPNHYIFFCLLCDTRVVGQHDLNLTLPDQ